MTTAIRINGSLISVLQTMIAAIIVSMVVIFLFFGDFKGVPDCRNVHTGVYSGGPGYDEGHGILTNVITLGSLVLGVGMMVDNLDCSTGELFPFHKRKRL